MQVLRVAFDLLSEALRRRWFVGLFSAISLVLLVLGLTLQLEVVDGAVAGSKFFGPMLRDLVPGQTFLGYVYYATATLSFYGGAVFMLVACSDFATELLAPGRIEHLLSLPVARWQLLFGTWLGVVVLAAAGTAYGSIGLTVLLGLKAGLWSWRLVVGSVIGWVGFCAIYAAMLAAAFFVRSAAASAGAGLVTLVMGILSSNRETVAAAINPGLGRWAFRGLVMPFPRLVDLAEASASYAMGKWPEPIPLVKLVVACFVFSAALLMVATWRFEKKDF